MKPTLKMIAIKCHSGGMQDTAPKASTSRSKWAGSMPYWIRHLCSTARA